MKPKDSRKMRKLLLSALLLLAMLTLAACSPKANQASDNYYLEKDEGVYYNSSAPVSPTPPSAAEGGGYSYDAELTQTAAPSSSDGSSGSGSVSEGRKLTFWAKLNINTKSFDADYKAILDMVTKSKGYVSAENMTDNSSSSNQGRRTTLEIKIPATGYNSFLDQLAEIGDTTKKDKWSDDLTSQYFDTEARIELLEMRRERLMGYLIEAEKASDIVEFERELSSVLYELDRYKGTKRQLDQLIDFSTVTITLVELITPETIGKDGEPLGKRASNAFGLSWYSVGVFLEDVVIFIAGAIPVLLLLVGIGVIVWVIIIPIKIGRRKYKESDFGKARAESKEAATEKKVAEAYKKQQMYQKAQAQSYPPAYYQQQQQQAWAAAQTQAAKPAEAPAATEEDKKK